MTRHTDKLMEKARTCKVFRLSPTEYKVSSPSGRVYDVTLNPDGRSGRCTCRWGTPPAPYPPKQKSGCSHVLAALTVRESEDGRKVQAHNDPGVVVRRKRRTLSVGEGVWLTSR